MSVKKRDYLTPIRSNSSSRFDRRLIDQIVKEVEGGLPRKAACKMYGMAYCTINEWMRKFGSGASRRNVFSDQQRRKIVRQVQEGQLTKLQARQLYKVSSKALNTWLRNATQQEAALLFAENENITTALFIGSTSDLQKQLQEATLKIKALETMIDIAEQEFKIAIRKKSGAKQ
ncbi:MAG: hypothetical protein HEQ40_15945 [Lacibacter sp.]|jgi:transposase